MIKKFNDLFRPLSTTFLLLTLLHFQSAAQSDSVYIRNIYTEALTKGQAYQNLEYLCKQIGPRLTGSEGEAKAIAWTADLMRSYGLDSVWLQPAKTPVWVRGKKESAKILSKNGAISVNIAALGNSPGTGKKGVKAEIIEVKSLAELTEKGEAVKGKIVFINQPMPLDMINTFESYSSTGVIRFMGPGEAAKLGAVGVVVRSLGTSVDEYPHTGSTNYGLNVPKIPAVAISTKDAEVLSRVISGEKKVSFYFKTYSQMLDPITSYNVIGELKGTEFPDEIIVFGGHLDSWDLAEGAHDDGAGMIHALEAVRILKENYTPKRTLRVVMFMNEESGQYGGKEYANVAEKKGEKHIAALESDAGGFLPLGFSIDAGPEVIEKIRSWRSFFEPYNVLLFNKGYGGADINPLKNQDVPLLGLRPDSQRYFEVHHSSNDVFENVNKRELELGCATFTSMIYLIDQHGL